ncbi:LicD family protein [Hungatella hathewayi]|uniref:LicD family protein n=1 Tax=Hungatella hathewayi TaxID=154046 RepID=UPI00210A887C|nr:LicD family protein [Hungatella hathewayi]MCQ5386545.1 LicD family protein [Hungatella hathewayi]
MNNYNELSLREIQLGAYGILKFISSLCERQGWRYFLTYGSMIGAVRNQGVIPWDDDIDIMIPRPDYEKLKKYFITHEKDLKPYKLFDKSTVPNYPHLISRISDQRYHLIFENEKDYGIGLFVDIYPLDGVGNDYDNALRLLRKNKRLASLCFLTSRKSFATDNTDSKIKMALKLPAYIWARLMGNDHYISKLGKLAQTYDYDNSFYVACAAWPAGKKYGRQRDVFKKELFHTTEMKFEDSMMPIPVGYDEFLFTVYGNYMIPPLKEDRKTHHTYRVCKK